MSRRFAWAAAVVLFVASSPSVLASPKSDVTSKTKEAMENYDMMDYTAARKGLDAALASAKKGKLDKDPVTAKVYVDIGITAFADGDTEGAKTAFIAAAKIDPKIQIDVAYKSPDLTKLLEEAKSDAKSGGKKEPDDGGVTSDAGDTVDCTGVKGLQHTIIDTAPAGGPLAIEAMVGGDISPSKVVVAYRTAGATDFTTKELSKKGECKYTGAIPAAAMKGDLVHYYVAALGENGKPMAAKGSSGSPNIIEIEGKVTGGAPTPSDDEDPISGGRKAVPKDTATKDGPDGGEVSDNATITGQKRTKVMITMSVGTGFGYVSGMTEGGNKVEQCCVGNSYIVLLPEVSYQASPQLAIGIAGRIGVPVGANVNAKDAAGHSSIAPGALLRVRYAFSKSGEGIRIMGQIGGGVMRNTIHVSTGVEGMDTDIVTQGPLLVGAGIGYIKRLGGSFAFVADLSALAGIAIVNKIGTTAPNSGVGADLSLGFAVGF